MLEISATDLRSKLRSWLAARLAILLVGPPGTGKTYNSRDVSLQEFDPCVVEVLDGGNESAWKALFPYKTPAGEVELGQALRASGYELHSGVCEKVRPGGVLIIDEVNRVPPELKTSFQLLASERIVPWPTGGTVTVDIAIVSTANESDLGVEEASRAELDRYDLVLRLSPTPEEMSAVVAGKADVDPRVASVIYGSVENLGRSLDASRVHLPEGIRLAISIARVIRTGTLGAADAFRAAAERCWPLGRRGASGYRGTFDGIVGSEGKKLARRLQELEQAMASEREVVREAQQVEEAPQARNLAELASLLAASQPSTVTCPALPLPRRFVELVHVFISCFGMGVAKHLLAGQQEGRHLVQRAGVAVKFGRSGESVSFSHVPKDRVERFLQLVLAPRKG